MATYGTNVPCEEHNSSFQKQMYSSGSNLCYTNSQQTLNEAHRRENVQYIGGIGFSKILLFF